MTMSELEHLVEQYCPSAPPHPAQQGRAGVTSWKTCHERLCVCCHHSFVWVRPDNKYCSNACRQRAYRERKHSAVAA